jgi:aspartokinase/homoserine dehydrogenase 1
LTEPHPWDDLSGQDVARKLVILARCAGLSIELEDVAVEALLPGQGWADLAIDDFWARLPDADAEIARRRADAVANGRSLRYLGRIEDGRARAVLEAVGPEHYAWGLARGENLVAFRTARYSEQALVVRGPGAGPEVTAAGVFAGILEAGGASGSLAIGA